MRRLLMLRFGGAEAAAPPPRGLFEGLNVARVLMSGDAALKRGVGIS